MRVYYFFAVAFAISSPATNGTPVCKKSSTITSPVLTGALISSRLTYCMARRSIFLGISPLVRAETRGRLPPVTATVQVRVRIGFVSSVKAYCSPRLQEFPVTVMLGAVVPGRVESEDDESWMLASSWQPIGQIIQVR